MTSVWHQAQRPLSLMRRARRCFRTRGKLQVAAEVFFKARLFRAEEGVGDGDQADVMMPAQPVAAFVMAQTEFFFQFAIVLFDPPARFGDADETTQTAGVAVCGSSSGCRGDDFQGKDADHRTGGPRYPLWGS